MSVAALRAEMLSILAGGAAWCQKTNAEDATGKPCPIGNGSAVKWDVFGALLEAKRNLNLPTWQEYHELYDYMESKIPSTYRNRDIESYNDDTDFAGILAIIN